MYNKYEAFEEKRILGQILKKRQGVPLVVFVLPRKQLSPIRFKITQKVALCL